MVDTAARTRGATRARIGIWSLILKLALLPTRALVAEAASIGMVADDANDSVSVFDPATRAVVGTVPVGPGIVGDCSITPDGRTGFVADFNRRLWVVDLSAEPPALATPAVALANPGEDTALTPDGRFLLVCDGLTSDPISVVDVATRTEVSTFPLGSNCGAVDVCPDGTVLAMSSNTGRVHRLSIDSSGVLSNSGEFVSTGWIGSRGPNNVSCAPDSRAGVVVRRSPAEVASFLVPGTSLVSTRTLSGSPFGISAAFAADNRVFVRSANSVSRVDVFDLDTETGELGAAPILTTPVGPALPFLGIDQLALAPGDAELWVPVGGALEVRDPNTGALLDSIVDPAISGPTGVCFSAGGPACGDGTVDDGEQCDDGNETDGDGCSSVCEIENLPPDCSVAAPSMSEVWPPLGGLVPVEVGGVVDPDGDPVVVTVTSVWQDEPVSGPGAGRLCPDGAVAGNAVAEVRAERVGRGDGRVYHLAFTADDGRGGTCEGAVTVCVPRVPGGTCSDQGPTIDSSSSCGPEVTATSSVARRRGRR